ncbi:MAG: DUF4153 domain-containing protein [Actinomycetota bacterium]
MTDPWRVPPAGLALAAGIFASATLPGRSFGLAWTIVIWMVLAAVAVRYASELGWFERSCLSAAALLGAAFTIRGAKWLLAIDVLAVGGLAIASALPVSTWRSLVSGPAGFVWGLARGAAFVLRPWLGWAVRLSERRAVVFRSSALVALLLAVFGALFFSADAAFASLAERFLVPDLDLGLLPARVLLGSIVVAGAGSLLVLRERETVVSPWRLAEGTNRFRLARGEWISALVAVDLLFAVFVTVQLGVLFGGHTRVLETAGLTYAEYAREGFFQLVVVAILTLGLMAAVVRSGETGESGPRSMRLLLGALCLLTLVVLVSAFTRMNLYQAAFGYTRARILVDVTIIWLAALFVALIVAGVRWQGEWLPRAVVALSAVTILGLNLYNPDARIASMNIARSERTGDLDLYVLADLGPDAVPALMGLKDPARTCLLASMQGRLEGQRSLWSFNLARDEARGLLEDRRSASQGALTC